MSTDLIRREVQSIYGDGFKIFRTLDEVPNISGRYPVIIWQGENDVPYFLASRSGGWIPKSMDLDNTFLTQLQKINLTPLNCGRIAVYEDKVLSSNSMIMTLVKRKWMWDYTMPYPKSIKRSNFDKSVGKVLKHAHLIRLRETSEVICLVFVQVERSHDFSLFWNTMHADDHAISHGFKPTWKPVGQWIDEYHSIEQWARILRWSVVTKWFYRERDLYQEWVRYVLGGSGFPYQYAHSEFCREHGFDGKIELLFDQANSLERQSMATLQFLCAANTHNFARYLAVLRPIHKDAQCLVSASVFGKAIREAESVDRDFPDQKGKELLDIMVYKVNELLNSPHE